MTKLVSNAVLDAKLDAIKEALDKHLVRYEKHLEEERLTSKEVDRLSQIESNRKWHLRAIWAAVLAGGVARMLGH